MLLITCPECGARPETEFVCGGETHIARPGPFAEVPADVWAGYLFHQANPRGKLRERWRHQAGCGLWFNLVRDTVTHEITSVYRMGDPKPEIA